LLESLVPSDMLSAFESIHGLQTLVKNEELRQEVVSFVEICFDDMGFTKMYVNFPKYNLHPVKAAI
jgi:hypothetical protein